MRIYRVDDFDSQPAPEPQAQDLELRRLVDLLPPVQKHLVERTYFGGAFMSVAAREVGLEKRAARAVRDEALAQLRIWMEHPPEGDAPHDLLKVEDVIPGQCGMVTEWGQCSQPAADELCPAHQEWVEADITPDPDYERAVVEGRKTPVQAFLSQSELHALVSGRYRGDGRRVDQYVTGDGLEMGDWDGR